MDVLLIFLLLAGLVAFLIWLGFQLAKDKLSDELDVQREVLRAEWSAMENSRRVNDVFFDARDAMRRASDVRHRPDPTIIEGEWS